MEALIEVRDAVVWRGDTRVFDGLTLTFYRGESAAIIGPNGAGKSTLLKLMTRELRPEYRKNPAVMILGQSQWDISELRDQIGLVSPDFEARYLDWVPGLDVVVSGLTQSVGLHGVLQAGEATKLGHARELLRRIGMEALADRPIGAMFTGQKRRIFLARALVTEPHTLVLDEPTAGLDLAADFAFQTVLRKQLHAGISALIVTHQVSEIPPEVNRVVLLKAGQVFADGAKQEVLTSGHLSDLYETPVVVACQDDYYFVRPGDQS